MDKKEQNKQKNALRMAVVTAFVTTFMGSALNLSVPALSAGFHTGAVTVGWVVTAYTLVVAACSVPMGKLADAKGRRPVLLVGIFSFGILSLACGFMPSIQWLIALRCLQGVAAGMIFSTNNAILISVFPGNQRGRVLGISTAATYVGLSLGPVLGGLLNQHFGWQSIFITTFFISAISFAFAWRGAPKNEEESSHRKIDVAGNVLFVATITALLYGLTTLGNGWSGWLILGIGVVLFVGFVQVEIRAENPVIRVTMFTKNRVFAFSNLAALLNYGATFAISYLGSIYLQSIMGYSSGTAGLILICMPLVQALFSPLMGRLSDRIAPWKLATAGMTLTVVGLFLFAGLTEGTKLWYMIMALVLVGFGFALFSSPNTNAVMGCVKPAEYSLANSILATMRTFGHSSSMAIVTVVSTMMIGNQPLAKVGAEELISTLHRCFWIFVGLCIVGILLSMVRKESRK